MKKRALCLLLAAVLSVSLLPLTARAAGDVAIDETNFPDATFRTYVSDNFDTDKDGSLSETEIKAAKRIDLHGKSVASLKGLENFSEITYLYCSNLGISDLDLSHNTKLREVYANSNYLTTLDVSHNPDLTDLDCIYNQLKSLDLSKNSKLVNLACYHNQISSLDLRANTALVKLQCYDNQIAKLDLSKNTALKDLICNNNQIKTLDISNNPGLTHALLYGKDLSEQYNHKYYYLQDGSVYYRLETDLNTELTGYLPAITTQPASKTVAAGKSVTFSVKATGAELQYQWQVKKGSGDWTNLSGKTSAKLTLTMKKSMDGYKYRCVVSNEAGKATSSAAKLTLMVKPKITTQPKSAKVKAGNNVTFKVKATGGALKYQWYWAKPGSNVWTKVSGGTKASLKISAKKSLTGRRYRCQVKNAVGTVYTKAVTLSVY